MGTVVQLKNQINNSYFQLRDSVEEKLALTEERIKSKLTSDVQLVQKMTNYHIETGGKRLRALLTLGSAKLCGYSKGSRDVNLAACVELIHSATLMHDDVIDEGEIRRGKETLNKIWSNHSSVLIGDYLLSRCFEMMVEDGNLEVLKLLSSTSSKIAQGEVLQLQHNNEVDMLEETYLKIISAKTAEPFAASTKVGAILAKIAPTFVEAANGSAVLAEIIFRYVSSSISTSLLCCSCNTSPWAILDEVDDNNFNTSKFPSSTIISKHLLKR